jgi:cytochrome c551/c552
MKYFILSSLFIQVLTTSLYADDGALLFNGNCVTCHNATQEQSAPSMKVIRERYLLAFSKKKEFVHYMAAFIVHPREDISIMSDKIKKYEIMPTLGYEKSVAQEIASYVYETKF